MDEVVETAEVGVSVEVVIEEGEASEVATVVDSEEDVVEAEVVVAHLNHLKSSGKHSDPFAPTLSYDYTL